MKENQKQISVDKLVDTAKAIIKDDSFQKQYLINFLVQATEMDYEDIEYLVDDDAKQDLAKSNIISSCMEAINSVLSRESNTKEGDSITKLKFFAKKGLIQTLEGLKENNYPLHESQHHGQIIPSGLYWYLVVAATDQKLVKSAITQARAMGTVGMTIKFQHTYGVISGFAKVMTISELIRIGEED